MKRYGVKTRDRGQGWAEYDERFDISKHPNEPNRFGYIVEIDPIKPDLTPKPVLRRLGYSGATGDGALCHARVDKNVCVSIGL